MEKIRLQKYCSQMGLCSRREAEDLIRQKKILINGEIAKLGDRVSGEEDISINGQLVKGKKPDKVILAFHKPKGVESTCAKIEGGLTLANFKFPERVFPIGRLDKDSRGLLLLTNDGGLANELAHPRYEHEKEYIVTVNKEVTGAMLQKIEKGIELSDKKFIKGKKVVFNKKKTAPCKAAKIDTKVFSLIIKEGRNRQIRRMCEVIGLTVLDLLRVRIKNVKIGELPEGKFFVIKKL